MKLSED